MRERKRPIRSRARSVPRAVLVVALLGLGCTNTHYVLGDSYAKLMSKYIGPHTGCPVVDLADGGRLAIDVLREDVDVLAAEVAALDADVRPIVILSAGAMDEFFLGPAFAGQVLNELASAILAIDPDLELLHLDYGNEFDVGFWDYLDIDDEPRWNRVRFPNVVDDYVLEGGLHLAQPAYVERLFSMARQYPTILCERPGPGFDGEQDQLPGLLN